MIQECELMIYFDNAATTLKKPEAVARAVADAVCTVGNASRGSHEASLSGMRILYKTRADRIYSQCDHGTKYDYSGDV